MNYLLGLTLSSSLGDALEISPPYSQEFPEHQFLSPAVLAIVVDATSLCCKVLISLVLRPLFGGNPHLTFVRVPNTLKAENQNANIILQ